MGLRSKVGLPTVIDDVKTDLTKKDYELILSLIGEATFKVKDIQNIYDLIIKLQKLHGVTNK
jgi:hypothetical protein